MNSDFTEKLINVSLFKGIAQQELEELLQSINLHEKEYPEGSHLIMQGMPYKALYVLVDGNCIGEMSDASGKVIKIEDFFSPYAIATALLFADDNRIPVTLTSRSPVKLVVIHKEDLLKMAQKNLKLLDNLLNDIANKFNFISSKLFYFKFNSLNEKILAYLSRQKKDPEGYVTLRQSIAELANLFGVERPSLSRAFSRLEKDGVIIRSDKRFRISHQSGS